MKFYRYFLVLSILIISHFDLKAQVDLADGLVVHYDFNGNVDDLSNNEIHGEARGATLDLDRFENCEHSYSFEVSPDLIAIPGRVMNGIGSFTVSLWVKTTSSGVVMTAANSQRHNEFFIQILSQGNIGTTVQADPRRTGQRLDGAISVADGNWHHIVVTRDNSSGEMEILVDGETDVKANKVTAGNELPKGALVVPNDGLYLGADQDCVGGCWDPSQQFKGLIDDLWVFDRVLSTEEINELYTLDESGLTPSLSLPSTMTTCDNTFELDAGVGFDSYLWSSGETTQKISVENGGIYHLEVKYKSCVYTTSVEVTFEDIPNLEAGPSQPNIDCTGGSVTLTASDGFEEYVWSNGQTGRIIQVNQEGEYFVTANSSCGQVTSNVISIGPGNVLELTVSASDYEINCKEEAVNLVAVGGFSSYTWSNGSNSRIIEVTTPGIYSLQVEDACGNKQITEVNISENINYFIPNAFTPNNDGKNETFEIDDLLLGSSISLINRWGRQVYFNNSYQNDWDGGDLPDGVYYYWIENSCLPRPIKGWVRILR